MRAVGDRRRRRVAVLLVHVLDTFLRHDRLPQQLAVRAIEGEQRQLARRCSAPSSGRCDRAQTIGDEFPAPGTATRHLMLLVGDQVLAYLPGATKP